MKTASITVESISPLLMHQFPLGPAPEGLQKDTPEAQAEWAVYRDPDTQELYIPGIAIQRTLVGGAAYSKGKGRASLQKPAAACFAVSPERCSLGTKDYVVDSRSVVIAATKGRIIRHRPRLDKWRVSFDLEFDEALLSAAEVRKIVEESGRRVGFLEFRPACKGPFGRFGIVKFEVQ